MTALRVQCEWPIRPLGSTHCIASVLRDAEARGLEVIFASMGWSSPEQRWSPLLLVRHDPLRRWPALTDLQDVLAISSQIGMACFALPFYSPMTLVDLGRWSSLSREVSNRFRPTPRERQVIAAMMTEQIERDLAPLAFAARRSDQAGSPEQLCLRWLCARIWLAQQILDTGRLPGFDEWTLLLQGHSPARGTLCKALWEVIEARRLTRPQVADAIRELGRETERLRRAPAPSAIGLLPRLRSWLSSFGQTPSFPRDAEPSAIH